MYEREYLYEVEFLHIEIGNLINSTMRNINTYHI